MGILAMVACVLFLVSFSLFVIYFNKYNNLKIKYELDIHYWIEMVKLEKILNQAERRAREKGLIK